MTPIKSKRNRGPRLPPQIRFEEDYSNDYNDDDDSISVVLLDSKPPPQRTAKGLEQDDDNNDFVDDDDSNYSSTSVILDSKPPAKANGFERDNKDDSTEDLGSLKVGDRISVLEDGNWSNGDIVTIEGNDYLVRWDDLGDQDWVMLSEMQWQRCIK